MAMDAQGRIRKGGHQLRIYLRLRKFEKKTWAYMLPTYGTLRNRGVRTRPADASCSLARGAHRMLETCDLQILGCLRPRQSEGLSPNTIVSIVVVSHIVIVIIVECLKDFIHMHTYDLSGAPNSNSSGSQEQPWGAGTCKRGGGNWAGPGGCLGALMAAFWAVLGLSWAVLGRLWRPFGLPRAGLGGLPGCLGHWEACKRDHAKIIEQTKEELIFLSLGAVLGDILEHSTA